MQCLKWAGMIAVAVASLAAANSARGQVTLDPSWPQNPRTFGGENSDRANSVQETSDGGYIVAGSTDPLGTGLSDDVYLIKLDAQGQLDPAWDPNPKTFGGEGWDWASSVQQTTDGGYIIAGETDSFGDIWGDVYLIKLDSQGNLDPAWDPNPKTFGGEGNDKATWVQQTSGGGYIVAGWTSSFGAGSFDFYLIKLDSAGNLDPAWDANPKTFGGEEGDEATSVQQTSDGGYIVAGWTSSFGAGSSDVYLIKLDSAGNLDPAWDPNPKTFGSEGYDEARSVQQTSDGGYIVAGKTEEGPIGNERTDVYLIKLDSAGNLDPAWDPNPKTLGGENSNDEDPDEAYAVQETADGGYIVTGYHKKRVRFIWRPDVALIKLDSRGDLDPAWDPNPRKFGGDDWDVATSVQQTSDGGYIVAGATWSTGAGNSDVYLVKLAPARHFLRGDCNGDGETKGTADALRMLEASFLGGVEIPCLAACDANGDGETRGVADALDMLTHNFLGGVTIPAPFPDCGAGQLWTDGPLGCDTELECN